MANAERNGIVARELYFAELANWLEEARLWHSVYTTPQSQIYGRNAPIHSSRANLRAYKEYFVPPLWKRLMAEVVDILILLAIKICLIVVVLEALMAFKLEGFLVDIVKMYPNLAIHIALIEVAQGILGLIYETYWLSSESCATPGKRYMGLMLIHGEIIHRNPGSNLASSVLVYPGARVTVGRAFTRSVVKHIFFTFMLPVYYIWTFLPFNRFGYDGLTETIVVEYNPNPRVYMMS